MSPNWLRMVGACFSILFLPLGSLASRASAQEAPSIVLIVTDDQRWDSLTSMTTVSTELVQKGVKFTSAFVSTPLCAPSRAAIMTGQYAHHNDVWRNTPPHGGFDSFADTQSLAVWLQGAGYTTGLIGKYINGYPAGTSGSPSRGRRGTTAIP
jgi:arylsulfatase A-like enzyme